MVHAIETASEEASGWRMYVLAAYYLLFGNFSITVIGFGVVMIGAGASLEPVVEALNINSPNAAIMAGIAGIWGVSLILLGVLGYGVLWANAKYARITAAQS
ncbi:hypothetical protein [Halomontanus rarus]|uniref:hypothetical protein n=1 Tax=Halomontanus rarus TaxID=3034020 RepID=UPI001A999BF9